ncbi:MAG: ATP-binding cassette domain-containing protein, partial [Phycisphaerae bacterium]|nr:ATP-binding cassette domain-containing protein [Phycisphaerae bacterium]
MIDAVKGEQTQAVVSDRQPILQAKGISKAFGHVQALDNVDFELYEAEVVALIGDNGAGKSTLVKILSGIYHKDTGQIFFEGQPVEIRGPRDAERLAGISTVYQDLALVDVRDVGSNIFLNMEPTNLGFFINFRKLYADAKRVIDQLHIDMP